MSNCKNDCMDFHVLKRFRQRFNVYFSKKDIDNIITLIINKQSEPIFQLSNSKRVHIVNYNGIIFGCVYNKFRKRIHTVFPRSWIDNGNLEKYLISKCKLVEVPKINNHNCTMPLNNKNKRISRVIV